MRNLMFTMLLSFVVPSQAFAGPKSLVILGDSLTEGYGVAHDAAYPALLEKKIQKSGKNWKVVNAGISGSTSASALPRLKWILKSKPDLLMICLGANDGLRGLKLEETRHSLSEAVAYAQAQGIPVVLAGLYLPPNYGKEYTTGFRKIYVDLAKQYKTLFIEFLLDGVAGNSQLNQADGIHPNEKGHEVIAETVFKALKDRL